MRALLLLALLASSLLAFAAPAAALHTCGPPDQPVDGTRVWIGSGGCYGATTTVTWSFCAWVLGAIDEPNAYANLGTCDAGVVLRP